MSVLVYLLLVSGSALSAGAPEGRERPEPGSADPEALEVIAGYLKAIGGSEALLAIEDRYEKFEVGRHGETGRTAALFERYLKRPNMVREDWDLDITVGDTKLTVLQTYNGKTGWTKMMDQVSKLEEPMITMLTHDKYVDDFFLSWKEQGYALRYRSDAGEVQKEPCHVIDVFPAKGDQESRYFFSRKTNLLLKKQWRTNGHEGPVRSELFYLTWRTIRNPKAPDKPVLFPFRQEQVADGDLAMERDFLEIRLNSGLSDAIFDRPKGPLFTGRVEPAKKDGAGPE